MSWEDDFRRNIERTRQRIMEIAPDMLDLNAHRSSPARPPPRACAQSTPPRISTAEPSFISRFRTTLDTPRAPPVSPTDETSEVDPLRPGPYPTCVSSSTLLLIPEPVHIIAYAPGTQISSNRCESAAKDCPLVILFHARPKDLGDDSYYTKYETLSRHLASYGFVVVSVQWSTADDKATKGELLAPILEHINSGLLGLFQILSNRLILIGHSHGGLVVDRSVNSALVKTGFTPSAIVLMSPSESSTMSNTYTDSTVDALLVLHDVLDGDVSANGGTSDPTDTPVKSGVLSYELAGYTNGGDVNSAAPQYFKHFAYAHIWWNDKNLCPGIPGSHFYQDATFATGYISAFLLAYVRGQTAYQGYFRRQQPMSTNTDVITNNGVPGIWHMHAEPSEFVLFNWASPMATADVTGGVADSITLPQGDNYTLNRGHVLRVKFSRGTQCVVTIDLTPTAKLGEYRLISFGLCQSNVKGYDNISGSATEGTLEGSISLENTQNNDLYSVKLTEIGGPLWYHGCLAGRRVCMEERVVPLSSVAAAVKPESINRITLRFDAYDALGKDAVVLLGNIKLIGKGP